MTYVNLKSSEIDFINDKTKYHSSQIIDYYRKFLYRFNNGMIDREQFTQVSENLFLGQNADNEKSSIINLLFDLCDIDNNGYIDFKEYLVLFWSRINGSDEEKLSLIFDLYDLDHSGYIDFHEMHSIVKMLFKIKYAKYNQKESQEMENYTLFTKQLYVSSKLPVSYYLAMDIMRVFDTDKNGKLSKIEFINGCLSHNHFRKFLTPLKHF
ncbi:unnamed protein product [Brachionus calyciflorus]|uniref:EF-hand domain-containing protein n=1 Tax=Brachionus calyciflorus TaxID=104777 RepID=A0A814CKS7_9BILA|nr:unnamed protein product [Brachionus calyciflorus]